MWLSRNLLDKVRPEQPLLRLAGAWARVEDVRPSAEEGRRAPAGCENVDKSIAEDPAPGQHEDAVQAGRPEVAKEVEQAVDAEGDLGERVKRLREEEDEDERRRQRREEEEEHELVEEVLQE